MFSSMPGLAGGIARDIREGTLKRYLIQPMDMIGYLLSTAWHIKSPTSHVIPALCSCSSSSAAGFSTASPARLTLAAFAVSLVLSFLVGFFFEASVGMVGFWFLEVTSLLVYRDDLELLHLGAHAAARPAAPSPGRGCSKRLPFQYMAYFPAVVFLGKVKGTTLVCTCWASCSGRSSSCSWRGGCTGWGCGATAPSEAEAVAVMADAREVLPPAGQPGAVHAHRELAFRGNFLVKVSVEVLWLAILLAFYRTVFARTSTSPAGTSRSTSSSSAASSR